MAQLLQRYWVFVGDTHYPSGGMHDMHGSYSSADGAARAVAVWMETQNEEFSWWHVVDIHTGTIIAASSLQGYHN